MSTVSLKRAKSERIAYIEFRLFYLGSVSRQDVAERFGCSDAVATRDLSEYQSTRPDNCEYDAKRRRYYKSEGKFKFIFDLSVHTVLRELVEGGQSLLENERVGTISGNMPLQLTNPNNEVVANVSRAIYEQKLLEITYISLNSGKKSRKIIPHSIFTDGLKWYVRAYDRVREMFINFNLTRIYSSIIKDDEIEKVEGEDFDEQWNSKVPLVLVPHPNIQHKDAIKIDYGMKDGELILYVKTSMVEFFLRKWNIDCSPEDRLLEGSEYQLWLKNNQALVGICEFNIAPGYINHKSKPK
ncbi:WYL domain-containing protein [uncultured Ferrimonas sp.]|uniref:WYL domain-containing protein n=1 Tax=uncultured Ferrimonas sp. TaxID=432640 RepID=UPI0026290DE4|nr:WYL domain-containing protein [uncultured Ferrimonas sp.]